MICRRFVRFNKRQVYESIVTDIIEYGIYDRTPRQTQLDLDIFHSDTSYYRIVLSWQIIDLDYIFRQILCEANISIVVGSPFKPHFNMTNGFPYIQTSQIVFGNEWLRLHRKLNIR